MRHDFRRLTLGVFGGLLLVAGITPASAQTDLAGLSIEDLLNTEITSVSRKEQTLSRTAAAVHVITSDDIRRSGATTLADVLRMAPGFSVGQIDSTSWAISARGFTGFWANKLLVLVDGRSVYSPMFSGVHWEMQNMPLSEIERIELVRGPGGTLWGANAVNGVINIITKRADETQGGALTASAGTVQRFTDARYGGRVGDRGYYRLSGRYSNRGTGGTDSSPGGIDDASVSVVGGRFDWRGDSDTVFVTGTAQDGTGKHPWFYATLAPPFVGQGVLDDPFVDRNVLFSWNRSTSSGSDRGIQAYYQNYRWTRQQVLARLNIADVEMRQRLTLGRHEVVFGAEFRTTGSEVTSGPYAAFTTPDERNNLESVFTQDEIELHRNVRIIPGVKLEHTGRTGFQWQPSLRGTWTPTRGQSVWAALSRAVRTQSKSDSDLWKPLAVLPIPGPLPSVLTLEGDPAFHSESVEALEAGYRWQRGTGSVDIAAFRNNYDDLNQPAAGRPYVGVFETQPVLVLPLRFTNGATSKSHGLEVAGVLRPLSRLRLAGSYSWLVVKTGTGSSPSGVAVVNRPVPAHQFQIRSFLDLPARTEVGAMLYTGSAVEALDIKAYQRLDLRFAWRARSKIELSVTGQNLVHDDVIEYVENSGLVSVPSRTAVVAGVTWSF